MMKQHYWTPALRCLSLLCAASLAAGCAAPLAFDIRRPIPWLADDEPSQATRMIAIWSDTVMTQPGQPGRRGFGGRLMFYKGGSFQKGGAERPIKVEGKLIVFAFDDTESDPSRCVPDKKYVFTPEQFAKHYSKSELGHSYSIWLPWDEVGGPQKKIALVARFESNDGALITSEMTTQLLPGRVPTAEHMKQWPATPPPAQSVQPASHRKAISASQTEPDRRGRMTTVTIPVTPGFGATSGGYGSDADQRAAALLEQYQAWQEAQRGEGPKPAGSQPPAVDGASKIEEPDRLVDRHAEALARREATATAASPGWPQATGFVPGRLRVQGGPIARPRSGRAPMRPHPAGWPSGHSESP